MIGTTDPVRQACHVGSPASHLDVDSGKTGRDAEPGGLQPRFLAGPELDEAVRLRVGCDCPQHGLLLRRAVATCERQCIDPALCVFEIHPDRMADAECHERNVAAVGEVELKVCPAGVPGKAWFPVRAILEMDHAGLRSQVTRDEHAERAACHPVTPHVVGVTKARGPLVLVRSEIGSERRDGRSVRVESEQPEVYVGIGWRESREHEGPRREAEGASIIMEAGPRSRVPILPRKRIRLFLLKLLSRLPLSLLYLLSPLVYFITYYPLGHRKHILFDNLRQCFPEKSEDEIVALAKQNYRNFSDVLIEMLKGISMSNEEILRRVEIQNLEPLIEYAKQKRPMLLLAGHHCNWDWVLLAACLRLPFPVDAVYKPLAADMFERLLLEGRERLGSRLIAPENFIAEIIKRRGQAVAYAMVADQTPVREEEKCWAKFLNRDTAFFVGADKIARMTRAPVFFVSIRRSGRGRYQARVSELAQPPFDPEGYPVMERYVRALEAMVLEHPADWLWAYNKWKYKKPLYG